MAECAIIGIAKCRAMKVSLVRLGLAIFCWERFGELLEDNSSSVGVSTLSRAMAPFLYCERSGALLNCYLARLFR